MGVCEFERRLGCLVRHVASPNEGQQIGEQPIKLAAPRALHGDQVNQPLASLCAKARLPVAFKCVESHCCSFSM
jgi:hypothetical protein